MLGLCKFFKIFFQSFSSFYNFASVISISAVVNGKTLSINLFRLFQGRLHKIKAGGAVLVPRANRGIFLLT